MRLLPPVIFLVSILTIGVGCSTTIKTAKQDPWLLVDVDGDEEVTKNGVTISVTPIDVRSTFKYPQYQLRVPLKLCDLRRTSGISIFSGGSGRGNTLMSHQSVLAVAFRVQISNNTDHTVSFSKATIQLEDVSGDSWKPITRVGDSAVYSFMAHMARRTGDRHLLSELSNVGMATIRAPTRDLRILPGKRFDGLAVFNAMGFSPRRTFPKAPLTLLFYDVTTATDAAGNATKRERFSFKFDSRVTRLYRAKSGQSLVWSSRRPRECPGAKR